MIVCAYIALCLFIIKCIVSTYILMSRDNAIVGCSVSIINIIGIVLSILGLIGLTNL
jgi:hypothetical protein